MTIVTISVSTSIQLTRAPRVSSRDRRRKAEHRSPVVNRLVLLNLRFRARVPSNVRPHPRLVSGPASATPLERTPTFPVRRQQSTPPKNEVDRIGVNIEWNETRKKVPDNARCGLKLLIINILNVTNTITTFIFWNRTGRQSTLQALQGATLKQRTVRQTMQ